MNKQGRILIVDDDELIRASLSRDLRRSGYSCTPACDGLDALEKLRAAEFDIVLCDLKMPRMDGIALLREIEKAKIDTVPIVLSGHGQIAQAVETTKYGAFDFIEKPAGVDVVRNVIERALKHRRIVRHAHTMSHLAEQWEATFDASPDMIVVLGPDRRIYRINQAVVERMGRLKEELVGKPCHETLCFNDHLPGDCPFLQDLQEPSGRSVEFTQAEWEGHFEITSAPLGGNLGDVPGSMHVIRDITDRKRTEDELRQARARAELLIGSISSILICLDENRLILQWNATAESTFGLPAGEAIGRRFAEIGIKWNYDDLDLAILQCVTEGQPVRLDDIRFARPDGKDRFFSVTLNPVGQNNRGKSGVLILGRDVTERKFLEAQLTHAQKLEGIGQLAAGIAHEINTPMQYVGDNARFLDESFADLAVLLEKYGRLLKAASEGSIAPALVAEVESAAAETDVGFLIEEIPRAIRQSLEGVTRVTKIVRAMRDFSHPGVEEKTAVDINEALESTITVSRNEWKYVSNIETDCEPDLPPVPCLPGELNQVFLNLIINAAHAIAEVVGDGSQGKGTISISTRSDGDWVEIRISDTGCGIPEKDRGKIFEPFFTTKEVGKGTGQGLAIARSVIADKHGGTISFETAVGKGTTFVVRLPPAPDQSQPETLQKELSHA